MGAINIQEETIIHITTADGQPVEKGDLLLIRATSTEDILCFFKGINKGYFDTETFTDNLPVKYRLSSIASVIKIQEVIEEKGE